MREMDEAVMRSQFYIGQKGQLMLRRIDKPNAGQACIACPFCGVRLGTTPVYVDIDPTKLKAVLESTPVQVIDTDSPQYEQLCEKAVKGEGPLAVPKEGEE